jgi:adenylate cyclase class 2
VAKVRAEIESDVETPAALREILLRVGFRIVYRYQKYRSYFRWEAPGTRQTLAITLDETPIGVYVELEGPRAAIDEAARRMGSGPDRYLADDYRSLHHAWLRGRGLAAADMVFDTPREPD